MTKDFYPEPVGQCIYCRSMENLSDEHIVPLSFNGRHILKKASCEKCQKITSLFEQYCARTFYGKLRNKLNYRTRHPDKRPKELPLRRKVDGKYKIIQVPAAKAPVLWPFIEFLPPGYFRNPPVREVGWAGSTTYVMAIEPLDAVYRPSEDLPKKLDFDPYARMLAKIAHCVCIGEFGLDAFEPWLPPYILGDDPHLSYVVGSIPVNVPNAFESKPQYQCYIALTLIPYPNGEELVGVQIWLRDFGTPAFVIAGMAKAGLSF